jgi:hypothetical protein
MSTPSFAFSVAEAAQLQSVKAGLLAATLLTLTSLAFTGDLPHGPAKRKTAPADAGADH